MGTCSSGERDENVAANDSKDPYDPEKLLGG